MVVIFAKKGRPGDQNWTRNIFSRKQHQTRAGGYIREEGWFPTCRGPRGGLLPRFLGANSAPPSTLTVPSPRRERGECLRGLCCVGFEPARRSSSHRLLARRNQGHGWAESVPFTWGATRGHGGASAPWPILSVEPGSGITAAVRSRRPLPAGAAGSRQRHPLSSLTCGIFDRRLNVLSTFQPR